MIYQPFVKKSRDKFTIPVSETPIKKILFVKLVLNKVVHSIYKGWTFFFQLFRSFNSQKKKIERKLVPIKKLYLPATIKCGWVSNKGKIADTKHWAQNRSKIDQNFVEESNNLYSIVLSQFVLSFHFLNSVKYIIVGQNYPVLIILLLRASNLILFKFHFPK